MPTIFERIDLGMQGNGLSASLAGEIGKLTGAAGKLQALIANPPAAIPQLAAGVGSVAVPSLDVSGFARGIASLEGAVPSDLSGVTVAITSALGQLKVDVGAEVSVKLDTYVAAVRAVHRLMNANFAPPPDLFAGGAEAGASGGPSGGGGAGGGGGGGGSGAGGGSGSAGGAAGGSGGGSASGGTSGGSGGATPPPTPQEAAAAARARRLEAINQVNSSLDGRAPFDAPGLVVFLRDKLRGVPRENVHLRKLPWFDDVLWLTATSVALREKDEAGLRQHILDTLHDLAAFLNSAADWPLGAVVARLQGVAAQLDAAALGAESATLAARLDAIAGAVRAGNLAAAAGDVAAANGALDALLPRLAALNANLFDGQVDAAIRALRRLPLELDRQMRRAAHSVRPANELAVFEALGGGRPVDVAGLVTPAAAAADLAPVLDEVVATLRSFNPEPLKDALTAAIDALDAAAGEIDRLLSGVAAQVALAFDALDRQLAAVDPAPLVAQIDQAIDAFADALEAKVAELFAPVKTAIAQAVGEIAAAASGFDPEQIVAALKDAIQRLAGALDAPEVKSAIGAIRQTIDGAAAAINALSFQPVTGGVVVEIDAVTALLKKVDPAMLGMPAKLALTGAVALLPDDLKPVTDPVEQAFGKLVDEGPRPLLAQVEAQPRRLLDEVRRYSPDRLVGDELGKPLADLVRELERFKPSALLAPVQAALAGLKQDLARRANPAQAFAPVEAAFDSVLARLDALNPAQLVRPLEAELAGAIDAAVTALPADEIVQLVADIVAVVKGVTDYAAGVRTALAKWRALFAGLGDGESQLRAWYQPVFQRLEAMTDVAALQPAFDQVAVAVERLKAAALATALDAAFDPARTALDALAPGDRLDAIARAYRAISPAALGALPDSPDKAAVQAVLARFSPIAADFARPFQGLERWRETLVRDRQACAQLLQHWDARFHGADGALAGFARPHVTAAEVRALFSEAIEGEIILPLAALTKAVHRLATSTAPVVDRVATLIEAVETQVTALVAGPGSLGAVGEALGALVARLRAIDLAFLSRELDGAFAAVKSKLQAAGPAAVRASVQTAFDRALASLDVANLLPQAELAAIDGSYDQILDGLRALDPKKIVVEAVQPEFEAKVLPLLAAFDVSVVIRAVIERLDALKAELGAEFGRVDDAYRAMLAAVPTISLTDLALDVDIDVDVGVDLGF